MPKERERKLKGFPRSKTGEKFFVVKTSKKDVFIINPLKKRRK